jgi:hypothetical protein
MIQDPGGRLLAYGEGALHPISAKGPVERKECGGVEKKGRRRSTTAVVNESQGRPSKGE